jgi:hypothetical protein
MTSYYDCFITWNRKASILDIFPRHPKTDVALLCVSWWIKVLQFCPLSDFYVVNAINITIMYVADVQPFYTHGKSVDSTGKLLDINMTSYYDCFITWNRKASILDIFPRHPKTDVALLCVSWKLWKLGILYTIHNMLCWKKREHFRKFRIHLLL